MKKLLILLSASLVFTACGMGPDLPDMPDMDNFESDLNKKLTDAGLDPVDIDKMTEDALRDMNEEDTGEALKISGETKSVAADAVTAGKLWPDVKAFAEANYPGSLLVGYNNYGPKLSNGYIIPYEKVKTGESKYWVYLFAVNQAAVDDGVLKEKSEAFGVKFEAGKLAFVPVEIFPEDIDGDQAFGDEWFGVDTDLMFTKAAEAIKKEYADERIVHITYDCAPTFPTAFADGSGECEVIFYNTRKTGYAVDFNASNGEVEGVEALTFQEL